MNENKKILTSISIILILFSLLNYKDLFDSKIIIKKENQFQYEIYENKTEIDFYNDISLKNYSFYFMKSNEKKIIFGKNRNILIKTNEIDYLKMIHFIQKDLLKIYKNEIMILLNENKLKISYHLIHDSIDIQWNIIKLHDLYFNKIINKLKNIFQIEYDFDILLNENHIHPNSNIHFIFKNKIFKNRFNNIIIPQYGAISFYENRNELNFKIIIDQFRKLLGINRIYKYKDYSIEYLPSYGFNEYELDLLKNYYSFHQINYHLNSLHISDYQRYAVYLPFILPILITLFLNFKKNI